ncbi:MAG: peptide ABC transporter substrate-binding protein [Lachnospiraceae bacterium]
MKMKQGWLISSLLCLVLSAALLAGCGSNAAETAEPAVSEADGEASSEETADAGESTGKLSISVSGGSEDAMNVNTAKSDTLEGLSACRHLYEGLYKLDQDGNVVLGQASDVQESEDGLTYTFTLRDDITWSDGTAVTAEDFVYGWQYLNESAGSYSTLLSMVSDAQATDEKTLVVTLAYPCSYLPSVLAFPSAYPVRKDIVEANGEAYATDPDKAVYNGAYIMTEWTHQQSVVMEAREDYYDYENISVGELTWQLMSDESTMLASYQSGDIIYSDTYPKEEAAALEGNGLHFTSGYCTFNVMFNVGEKGPEVLKDQKVREAMTLVIDRQRLVDIRNLNDEVADTYSPSGLTNADGVEFNTTVTPWYDLAAYEQNCEKAKELLKEAGYENGQGFPALTYIVNNNERKEMAEMIINDWKEVLGITSVTVEIVDGFFAQRDTQDYDLAYFGWYMDYPDISNMLYTMTTESDNDSGYSNADYDQAYNDATANADVVKQWEAYAECERILAEDLPIAPLLHAQNSYLFDDANYDGLVYYCGNFYFGYVSQK